MLDQKRSPFAVRETLGGVSITRRICSRPAQPKLAERTGSERRDGKLRAGVEIDGQERLVHWVSSCRGLVMHVNASRTDALPVDGPVGEKKLQSG